MTYVIAEAGVNHNGDMIKACRMVDVAAAAGADAVKFQAFNSDKLGRTMLKPYEFNLKQFEYLAGRCWKRGIHFLCSAFDIQWLTAIDPLVMAHKIPSSKLTDNVYLSVCGALGKPIYMSTGLSDCNEIQDAIYDIGDCPLTILHCTTDYPPEMEDLNLSCIDTLRNQFHVDIGYSDHTRGNAASTTAVALGATVIEKHFTLSRESEGPDQHMSIEPEELRQFIQSVRYAEEMLGDGIIRVEKGAEKNLWIKHQYNLSKEKL